MAYFNSIISIKTQINTLLVAAFVQEGEAFTKTSCYHYFHCHCLGRYVSHSESELRQREKELEEDKTRERTDEKVPVSVDLKWLA